MAESEIHSGKTSRNLVLYTGIALLAAGTIGFVLQYSIKGGEDDVAKQHALKERQKIEAAQLTGKVVSEADARKDIDAKTAAVREKMEKEKRDRDAILGARPSSNLPPPPLPRSPGAVIGDDSMRQYEMAKAAVAPGSKEASSLVAYEDFPGAKKNFASVVQDQATLPPKDGEPAQSAPQASSPDEDKNVAWAEKTGTRVKAGTADYLKPEAPVGKSVLQQGTVINAVTRTAINTRLPGQIVAMVTQDVYDSISGDSLLLPKGSRLIGEYNTSIMEGQNRVMMAFTRLILPTGVSVKLGAMSASDALGMAGAKGQLNTYFFRRLGSSLLIALLADRVNQPSGVTIINTGQAASSATAAGEVLSKMATAELERSTKITPDITLTQGSKVTLILAADLALPPSITQKYPTEE